MLRNYIERVISVGSLQVSLMAGDVNNCKRRCYRDKSWRVSCASISSTQVDRNEQLPALETTHDGWWWWESAAPGTAPLQLQD